MNEIFYTIKTYQIRLEGFSRPQSFEAIDINNIAAESNNKDSINSINSHNNDKKKT